MPHSDAERQLLLGLLALQNHFLDRDGLLAGFNAWVADRSKPLPAILVDRGLLTPPAATCSRPSSPSTSGNTATTPAAASPR